MESQAPSATRHSERLVEFATSLSPINVPTRMFKQAQACFIDSIGCGLFGATQSWGEMMADNTLAESGVGKCTLLGRTQTIAPAPAALVNGTAIHGYEFDDVIAGSIVHPGAVVISAALAAAEHANVSGSRLLLGVIAGYEAMMRVSLALGLEPSQRGFHMTPIVGPIGATFAAGVTLSLTPDKLLAAIGLACSASSGIKSFAGGSGGGMVKRMHAGRSAEAGVRMCQLADRGFAGPRTALDGKFGLLEVFSGRTARAERLTEDLGTRWAIESVWVKVYPFCGGIHSAVQALQQMRGDVAFEAGEIKKVCIGTTHDAVRKNCDPAPSDTMGAQYSLPYCAAVALLANPGDPAMFSELAVADPKVRELANRIELHVDEQAQAAYPHRLGARVELHLTSGEVRTATAFDAHGTPADPCTDSEREQKFRRLAAATKSSATINRIIDVAHQLDQLPSVRMLSEALRS